MKKGLILLPLIAIMLIAPAAMAITNTSLSPSAPTTIIWQCYGDQFQWRALTTTNGGGPFDAWSYWQSYGQYPDTYALKGNTLSTTISFEPTVTDQVGGTLVYMFNSEMNIWILPPTMLTYYYALYGPWKITNWWTGYVAFNGAPTAANYVEDVMYQWVYIYPQAGLAHNAAGLAALQVYDPFAVWDQQVGAWLVGISVYPDNVINTPVVSSSGSVPFPSVFVPIEPFAPGNYDPLHL